MTRVPPKDTITARWSMADELLERGRELAVESVLITYHTDGKVVICAWGDPIIDLPEDQLVATGRTVDIAAKRVLQKLTKARRLKRIADWRECENV